MSTRATWQTQFFIQEVSTIDSRIDFATGAVGLGGPDAGPITMLSLNPTQSPKISTPSFKISNPKSYGNPYFDKNELILGVKNPITLSLSMALTPHNLRLFLKSLFQNIAVSEIGTETVEGIEFKKLYAEVESYSTPEISYYLAILQSLFGGLIYLDKESNEIWGGIATSINISGQTGSLIQLDVDFSSTRYNRANVIGVISNDPRLKYLRGNGSIPEDTIQIYAEDGFNNWVQLDSDVQVVNYDTDFTDPDDLSENQVQISNDTGNLNFSTAALTTYANQFVAMVYSDANTERNSTYKALPINFNVTVPPLKFQNLNFELDNNLLDISQFKLHISNNPEFRFNEQENTQKILLGRVVGELSATISWSDSNFGSAAAVRSYLLNSTHKIYLYWGNKVPLNYNDECIELTVVAKSANVSDNNNEVSSDVVFNLVSDGAELPVKFSMMYLSYLSEFIGIGALLGIFDGAPVLIDLWHAVFGA